MLWFDYAVLQMPGRGCHIIDFFILREDEGEVTSWTGIVGATTVGSRAIDWDTEGPYSSSTLLAYTGKIK